MTAAVRNRRPARRIASAGILALVFIGGPPADASPDDWWFGRSRVMIRGAAASHSESGNRGLAVYARNDGAPEDAWGQFRFGEDVDGGHGDAGDVRCLTRDAAGLMQVSGRIFQWRAGRLRTRLRRDDRHGERTAALFRCAARGAGNDRALQWRHRRLVSRHTRGLRVQSI
jgi:hypothetical protein